MDDYKRKDETSSGTLRAYMKALQLAPMSKREQLQKGLQTELHLEAVLITLPKRNNF